MRLDGMFERLAIDESCASSAPGLTQTEMADLLDDFPLQLPAESRATITGVMAR